MAMHTVALCTLPSVQRRGRQATSLPSWRRRRWSGQGELTSALSSVHVLGWCWYLGQCTYIRTYFCLKLSCCIRCIHTYIYPVTMVSVGYHCGLSIIYPQFELAVRHLGINHYCSLSLMSNPFSSPASWTLFLSALCVGRKGERGSSNSH